MVEGACVLCKKDRRLRKSHIIPRFVSKWLKETSATGYMRGIKNPERRVQDLPSLPLLCEDCEQRFSKLESYFASKVYYPILNDHEEEITYSKNLRRFIISLSWRTLVTGYAKQVKYDPWIADPLNEAEEIWRRHLLDGSLDSGFYEHHMYFIDFAEEEADVPKDFHWYALRATDSTLASNRNAVFSFTHFPHVVFVSTVYPRVFINWTSTKIEDEGKFSTKSRIDDYFFWDFLVSRVRLVSTSLDTANDEKIMEALEKQPPKRIIREYLKAEEERKGIKPLRVAVDASGELRRSGGLLYLPVDTETLNSKQ